MAYSFQSFGTKFYGKRDFRQDGTYVTTEWFVLAWIPIIPLRSVRVREGHYDDSSSYPLISQKQEYQVFQVTRPKLKQVLSTYAFFCLLGTWIIWSLEWQYRTGVNHWIWPLVAIVPVPLPFLLRWIAK